MYASSTQHSVVSASCDGNLTQQSLPTTVSWHSTQRIAHTSYIATLKWGGHCVSDEKLTFSLK